jgi:hypothetical protein
VCAFLTVTSQLAVWLMRLVGLRIGEAYRLFVGDYQDDGTRAWLRVETQGGGGYPGIFGLGIAEFHVAQQRRAEVLPTGMATHDTKRGEDIRARLAVLAELSDEWGETARRLMALAPVPNLAIKP